MQAGGGRRGPSRLPRRGHSGNSYLSLSQLVSGAWCVMLPRGPTRSCAWLVTGSLPSVRPLPSWGLSGFRTTALLADSCGLQRPVFSPCRQNHPPPHQLFFSILPHHSTLPCYLSCLPWRGPPALSSPNSHLLRLQTPCSPEWEHLGFPFPAAGWGAALPRTGSSICGRQPSPDEA